MTSEPAGTTAEAFAFPLSFAQRRLWFLDRLQPNSPFYNVPLGMRLEGRLDLAAMHRALEGLVRRHEALRTRFGILHGEPVQIVSGGADVPLPVTDLTPIRPADRLPEARRLAQEEAQTPFDLSRGPLLRARLFRLDADDHVLVLNMHHIVCDAWSLNVLARELGELYGAFAAGETPRIPELPLQYADFSVWQREWMSGPALDQQLAYWREKLEGMPTALDLPTDRPRPVLQSYRGAGESLMLAPEFLEELRLFARREGASLFMVLLAAFKVVLARYTGRTDLVVGSPIANRTRPEIEGLIGFFVNALALRTDLSGDPPFRTLLARVREVALGAYAHQDIPFERLVEELQPQRVNDRNPLFEVMFVQEDAPRSALELSGITLRPFPIDLGTAKFDLTVYNKNTGNGLRVDLEYSTDLYEAATIRRMLAHYRQVLAEALAVPDRRVSAFTLGTEEERRLVLQEWGGAPRVRPPTGTVHRLFEAQVARAPDAIAIVAGGECLTYDELDRRANRLARDLSAAGVGPGARVGIALERSAALVVAMLAALKAGAAYLPLDPSYPRERLRFMLEDAGAAAIVTRQAGWDLPSAGLPVIDLGLEATRIAARSDEDLESEAHAADMAYVMYTSGSTGKPKGVAVPHCAVVRLVRDTDYVRLEAADRVAQVSNSSFDAITFEVWGALLNGGRLIILPRDVLLSPTALSEEIRRHGITVMFVTAALFRQFVAERPDAFGDLRDLLVGGEALDPGAARALLAARPPRRLLNVYGPTECTTFATWFEVAAVPEAARSIAIGRPIADTTAYVLDRRLHPAPLGVSGELYLGGPGVAHGYWQRPGLTAERFVPDPWGGEGARLYRTGDRVRWLADGGIEFLGRLDSQVKLRGFRIEPGEVEAALASYPAVSESAVVVREDSPGEKRLVAYIVANARANNSGSDLPGSILAHLRERLPDHMIPSAIVVLPALPLTPNGKLDRGALPPPEGERATGRAGNAARTLTEARLAAIWSEILGVSRVGREDDFFELGGHSLLAVKLFARLERDFGERLPLATLFRSARLDALAAELDAASRRNGRPDPALVPLQPDGNRPPLFIVHNIWGDLLRYRPLAAELGADQPVYGFEAPALENGRAEMRTLQEIAASYVAELRGLRPDGPYHLCGYCAAGALTLEIGRQLHAQGAQVGLLAVIDGACPGYGVPRSLVRRLGRRVSDLGSRSIRNLRLLPQLRREELPAFLRARARNLLTRVLGLPAYRLSVRLGRPVLPTLADRHGALSHATQMYRASRFQGRVTLIRSEEFDAVFGDDPYLGWGRVADGGVALHWVAGLHLTMMQQPFVTALAARLRMCMDRSLDDVTVP